MSIQQIIKEALEKSPLGVKEAVQEELRARVAEAISAKMEEVELGEAIRYSRSEALKKDKEHGFYADEDDGQYHVFGASTGYSYGQHDNKSSAEKHARELNKTHSPHIKESFDLSDYTVEELEDFIMSEDFDQLDEISKGKLAAYVKKAAGAGKEGMAYQARSMTQAAQPDTANKADYKKSQRKVNNRSAGIQRAADRLAK